MPTRTFSIRLTPEQLAALKAAAGGRGATLFARDAVLAAVGGRRMTRRKRERDNLHISLALVHAALMDLVDTVGLGQRYSADPGDDRAATAGEIAELREEIRSLVSAVVRLGRRVEDDA